MWSKLASLKSTSGHPNLWSNHQDGSSSRKQKTAEKNEMWSVRKQPTEICGHTEPKPRGQAMWSEAFESREAIPNLKGFFFFRRCCIVT